MSDIKVGDEVRFIESERTFVVAFINGNRISGFNARGDIFDDRNSARWVKTGRHFPEVSELLKKMGSGA